MAALHTSLDVKALTDRIRRLRRVEELFAKLRREGCLPRPELIELVDSVAVDVEFLARTYGGGYRPRSLMALLTRLKELAGSYECVPSLEVLLASLRRAILLALPIPIPPPIAEELSERLPEILRSSIGFALEDLASDLGFTLQLLIAN